VSASLPADGPASVAGIALPAGKRIGVGRRSGRGREPALWATGEYADAPAAWTALRERLAGTGLVPLLLSDLQGQPGRPWESGELSPEGPEALAGLDAPAVLRELWDSMCP